MDDDQEKQKERLAEINLAQEAADREEKHRQEASALLVKMAEKVRSGEEEDST